MKKNRCKVNCDDKIRIYTKKGEENWEYTYFSVILRFRYTTEFMRRNFHFLEKVMSTKSPRKTFLTNSDLCKIK